MKPDSHVLRMPSMLLAALSTYTSQYIVSEYLIAVFNSVFTLGPFMVCQHESDVS